MIDANHLYTLHHTYTGTGCAQCGKAADQHTGLWSVDGKQVSPEDIETVRPTPQPRPKNLIQELMDEAGVAMGSPEWGAQYNLTNASLSDFGIRCGLDPRIEVVMKSRGLGEMTEKGKREWRELLLRSIAMLRGSPEVVQG